MHRSLLSALLLCALAAPASAEARRPNLVFILADDLGWGELGCYGQKKIPTPHLDRLAREGTRFTRHYSGAPVCAPSRGVLMTGRHLGRAEIRGNQQAKVRFPEFTEGQHPLSAGARTFAQDLRDAGYANAAFGKWGLGPVGSTGDPQRLGFDLFFGYNCQAVAHSFFPAHLWRNAEKIPLNAKPIPGHRKQPEGTVRQEDFQAEHYAPARMMTEALAYLETRRDARTPFFLYLPFIEPHVALQPPPERVAEFPAEWDDQPYRGENGYLPHPRPRAAYAAMIADLDRHVGRILEALDRLGLAENTFLVFTSDNGPTHPGKPGTAFHIGGADPAFFNSTAGLRGYKGSVYEGGLRVPLLVRWPGKVAAGAVEDTPSAFVDWYPTLLAAAGLPVPADLDGENLLPRLTGGPAPQRRKPLLWAYPEYGGQVAILLGEFKVLRRGLKTRSPEDWEVYHLGEDPGESRNLAAEHPGLIREAERVLGQEIQPNPVYPLSLPMAGSPRS
jgi:arylsulfatase A-like enzyme